MTIYLDTNILIYLLEDNGSDSIRVADMLDCARAEGSAFVTSVLTLTEFMVGSAAVTTPLLEIPNMTLVAMDTTIAQKAGELQRTHGLTIGDSIHVATAISLQTTSFFTNDRELAKRLPKYIQPVGLQP